MSKTILLQRMAGGADSSFGLLYLNPTSNKPDCFIIEDEHRELKVMGETRVDAGRYEIVKRITEESKKTLQYRGIYNWFDYHLMLLDTPRHKWVYIHHGNTERDTDACLLTNYNCMFLDGEEQEYQGGRSRDAFKFIYQSIEEMLQTDRVFIVIKDEEQIVL